MSGYARLWSRALPSLGGNRQQLLLLVSSEVAHLGLGTTMPEVLHSLTIGVIPPAVVSSAGGLRDDPK